jgi:hypothetical protein
MARQETTRKSVLDSFQTARERILGLCREKQFMQCLSKALSENVLEDLEIALSRLQQNDIYVGALGVQGVGKSTLLNALLFGRRILPWDVNETTAVLTKVYRSDNGDERAEVVFRDGQSKNIVLDPDSLREYVHNEFNPSNQKKVKELKCFVNSPLLSQGICLVDTPGVASLTEEIGRVTLEFLPALSASIFITLTTPCLTKTEVDFLESAWQYCGRFFFVQNVWGENRANIEEATADIRAKLLRIGEEHGKKLDPKVYPVDVHRAIEGLANSRAEDVRESGIAELVNDVRDYIGAGPARIRLELFQSAFQVCVAKAIHAISVRAGRLDEEASKVFDEAVREEKQFRKRAEETEDKWRDEEKRFLRIIREATRQAEERVTDALDNLRERLTADIEGRKMNAEHVGKSFEQRVRVVLKDPLATWEIEMRDAIEDLKRTLMEEIRDINLEFDRAFGRPDADEAKGWEFGEGFGEIFKWLGGLGITLLAGEVVFAWLGIAATASAAAGPVGWIVSGGLLLGGLLLKKWCEQKAVTKLRKAVSDALRTVKKDVLSKVRSTEKDLEVVAERMRTMLKEELEQLRWQFEQIRQDARKSDEERKKTKEQLLMCKKLIKSIESQVLGEIASCLRAV